MAAEALQRKLASRFANRTLPIKADNDVTDSMIKDSHILLVGRPATNRVSARLARALPVSFGAASFTLAGETYAHPLTAVVAAGPNPMAADRSVVIFAGLSADATWHSVEAIGTLDGETSNVILSPAGGQPKRLAIGIP